MFRTNVINTSAKKLINIVKNKLLSQKYIKVLCVQNAYTLLKRDK